ncbi:MAG TPA: hypothetical protein VKR32_19665, partial [Puia sp.]|nr:hypothetical protein [Puia sp.]
ISPDDSLCLAKQYELGFDINFLPNHHTYFGYVLRIISGASRDIDLIYDQKQKIFRIVVDDDFSKISFSVDSPRMYRQWNQFKLKFNLENQVLQFDVNGKSVGSTKLPEGLHCFKFLWGANDFQKFNTKDIPPMQIKDIRITEEGNLKYFWPLDQMSGDTCYDRIGEKMAVVKNPNWIRPKHQQWQLLSNFSIGGDAGVAYNPKQDELYVVGNDSLAVYSLTNEQRPLEWLPSRHLNLRLGNQAIYDTIRDKLYDVYVDQHRVVSYDFTKRAWSGDFEYGKLTEFWHFNKFISPLDSCLYIVGGYGQLKYKNLIQRYSFVTKSWNLINSSGDYFSPRYLAALGMDPKRNAVYIIGGFGSRTGDQLLGPGNFYDLLRFNLSDHSFKAIYTLKPTVSRFAFANSLVIDPNSEEYYALIYPNDSTNSKLQIIKGSFRDSAFSSLANSIPYSFHDIESFSDLYYSPISNKLFAVVLHYSKIDDNNRVTEVKIYSVNFSPVPTDIRSPSPNIQSGGITGLIVITGTIIALALGIFIWRKMTGRTPRIQSQLNDSMVAGELQGPAEISYLSRQTEKITRSSIYLFGQFRVFDKDANDLTSHFSPLLKELFLLIATNTFRKARGISSAELDEILWHDKPDKDAKNNRAVNIAKLKVLLEKIGQCTINKDSGLWQFHMLDGAVHMDYKEYIALLQHPSLASPEYIHALIEIIRRGAFLYQTEYNWLDDIKSEISNTVIELCLGYLRSHSQHRDPEFAIEICNCIFYFDQLNEDALIYKCKSLISLKRHTFANNIYLKFMKDYKDIYGTNFPKTFHEVIV